MNELQLGLLAIGGIVVLAVVIFNRWQERKFRRQAEQNFQSRHDDVLLSTPSGGERMEPVLDADDDSDHDHYPIQQSDIDESDEPSISTDQDQEPVLLDEDEAVQESGEISPEPELTEDDVPTEPLAATDSSSVQSDGPDARTEFIAMLSAGDPISAHAFQLMAEQIKPVGKPVRWLGQQAGEPVWQDAVMAKPGSKFVHLAACLLLADRSGALQKSQLDEFCDMAQAVAANLYAVIDLPDKQAALDLALDLDQFCADVDVLIGVNLVSKEGAPFPGTKLRGLAEAAGMSIQADGQFHYIDDQGNDLFSLSNLENIPFGVDEMKRLATHGVNFVFDVPKASGGLQAFNQMILSANQFVIPLGALLVDDNRRELTEAGLNKTRQQLADLYTKMAQRQIAPGSPCTKRLFG
ncbi:MAG: cell division protein ZipA C-terminal FtsZ-binding domain-containing protein [Sulfuricellaceae bacterium]|nr:cell division protein ZipA C-terminal FtsZ-binding domain-containing protein [Sulfuricellaceae bacterium]